MKYLLNVMVFVTLLVLVSCSNKPSENDYIGTWIKDSNPSCSFEITKEGTSFIIRDNCGRASEAVYTMTENGSLTGLGGIITVSYNKESKKLLYAWPPLTDYYSKK